MSISTHPTCYTERSAPSAAPSTWAVCSPLKNIRNARGIDSCGKVLRHVTFGFWLWSFGVTGRTLDGLVPLSLEPVRESLRDVLSVLAWLEMCPFPETIRAYPEEQCQHLARRYPSENAADGRVHQWQGYAWDTLCPPLEGEVQVTLAVALPPSALAPFSSLLLSWSILARTMRAVL